MRGRSGCRTRWRRFLLLRSSVLFGPTAFSLDRDKRTLVCSRCNCNFARVRHPLRISPLIGILPCKKHISTLRDILSESTHVRAQTRAVHIDDDRNHRRASQTKRVERWTFCSREWTQQVRKRSAHAVRICKHKVRAHGAHNSNDTNHTTQNRSQLRGRRLGERLHGEFVDGRQPLLGDRSIPHLSHARSAIT